MIYSFLWYFVMYSFIGWISEVAYAAVVEHRFVNRGFLFGPVCPIYGFGIGLIYVLLAHRSDNIAVLWLGSVVVTSGIELITGFVMDKLFHNKWWDYSNLPLNIGGYICLPFSLLWGFACVGVIKLVFPLNDWLIGIIPKPLGIALLIFFCTLFAADTVTTVMAVKGLNRQLEAMEKISSALHESSEKLGDKVAEGAMNAAEKYGEVKEKISDERQKLEDKTDGYKEKLAEYKEELGEKVSGLRKKYEEAAAGTNLLGRRLIGAFPHMKHKSGNTQLEELRRRIRLGKQSGKKTKDRAEEKEEK